MTKKILAVFAHPDDETFSIGGTVAHYAANGVEVTLVCATNGDAGEISDPGLATQDSLPAVRQEELRCAASKLGISQLIFLNYRDSGMAGAPENEDPRAFVNVAADEVVARLVAIIRRLRPDMVITFEPNGGYGHPDHIAIHGHTVAAYHASGDASLFVDLGAPWQPDRLLYTAIPRSFFVEMRDRLAEMGEDTSMFDQWERVTGWPDDQVDVVMDVADSLPYKWAALQCHATQFGPDNLFRRLPEPVSKQMMSKEYFAFAHPKRKGDSLLTHLFADL